MSDDESLTPSLREVIRRNIALALSTTRTMLVGHVVSYDSATHTATVQPEVQKIETDETGARVVTTHAQVHSVPVAQLGTKSKRILVEPRTGDPVMLIASSVSLEQWKQRKGGIVDPRVDPRHHHHHISDLIAIPFYFGHDEVADPTTIEVTDTHIDAGGTSTVALKSDVHNLYSALVSAPVLTALAGIPVSGTAPYAAALATALGLTWPVGAGKLRG